MQEKDSPKFLIGEDNGVHDGMLHNELQELKMEKLSHRVSLLTILIPCMIGIILTVAYLDIKDRVTRAQDTGSIGTQKLARDIESKFSSLSLEQAKIKEALSKLPSLENSSAFVQSRLKNMQDSLKQVESSSISRNELSQTLQEINDKYDAIPAELNADLQNLTTASQQLAEDSKKLSGRLDQLFESLKEITQKMKRIDESLAALEAGKISKSELDFALRLKEIAHKQSLLEAVTSLEKKLDSLEGDIRLIQKDFTGSRQNSQGGVTGKSVPAQEETTGTVQETENAEESAQGQTQPGQPPGSQAPPVQPEAIVEQNIE